jgi:hypothetical protein
MSVLHRSDAVDLQFVTPEPKGINFRPESIDEVGSSHRPDVAGSSVAAAPLVLFEPIAAFANFTLSALIAGGELWE